MINLTLPYPPTINHYYVRTKRGMAIGTVGLVYRSAVKAHVREAKCDTLTGALAVTIHAYPPDKRKRDIDNIQKCLLDALEKAHVYENDNQIKDLHTIMCEPCKGGKAVVAIRNIQQVIGGKIVGELAP